MKLGDTVVVIGIKAYENRVGIIVDILSEASVEVEFENGDLEHFHPNILIDEKQLNSI